MLKKSRPITVFSLFLVSASGLLFSSCNLDELVGPTLDRGAGGSVQERVVLGLRSALSVGIDSSSAVASKVNGYLANKAIQILLPEEAEQALKAAEEVGALVKPFASELKSIQTLVNLTSGLDKSGFASNLSGANDLLTDIDGLESISDSVVKYMNRAAEYAAPRSVPIFKNAITGMSITDGLSLLNSSDSTAATGYLNGKTFNPLVTAYTPIVDSTLALVPLTKYWGDFRSVYNSALANYQGLLAFQDSWNGNAIVSSVSALQIEVLKPVNYAPIADQGLGEWTTDKALVGLFFLVGEEEKEIRRDPFGYVKNLTASLGEVLSEVFGEIMDMGKGSE